MNSKGGNLNFLDLAAEMSRRAWKISEERLKELDKIVSALSEDDEKYEGTDFEPLIKLFDHQRTLIRRCQLLEAGVVNGFESTPYLVEFTSKEVKFKKSNEGNTRVRSNFGVICDSPGSGKSFCALALVALKPFLDPYPTLTGSNFDRIQFQRERKFEDQFVHFKTNLLVAPHGTIPQWKQYIKLFPMLKTVVVACESDVRSLVGSNDLRRKFWFDIIDGNYDLILVGSTFYETFFNRFLNYRTVKRVRASCNLYTVKTGKFVPVVPALRENVVKKNVVKDAEFDPTVKDCYPEDFTIGDEDDFFIDYLEQRLKVPISSDKYNPGSGVDNESDLLSEYICWNRVMIDEVDTIKFSRGAVVFHALFNWFISSSIGNMLFPTKSRFCEKGFSGFASQLSPYYRIMKNIASMPHVAELFVKNKQDYVQACIALPPIQINNVKCKSIEILQLVQDKSMQSVIAKLNADDYAGVSEILHCQVNSPIDAVKACPACAPRPARSARALVVSTG